MGKIPKINNNFSQAAKPLKTALLIASLVLLFLLLPLFISDYWILTLGYVGIYILMGIGLNIVVGYAGLLDIGYAAFFALGAYSYALLASSDYGLHYSFWPLIFVALCLAATSRFLLGLPVLRLRGDYLAIVTLGFGAIADLLLRNMTSITQGSRGIKGIYPPQIFNIILNQPIHFYYLILVACLLAVFISARLKQSRMGRAWEAIREDETAAELCGIDTTAYKMAAFVIGGAFAGVAGVFFAARQGYVSPDDFSLMVSINVLCVIIIGGMGSIPGVIIGAFILIGLPEVLRAAKEWRMMIFGALLVGTTIFRPQGIFPSRRARAARAEEEG